MCEHEEKVFIIGGATVYKQSIEKINHMYITWVHSLFHADTFFPEINFEEWDEVSREDFEPNEKNEFSYSFVEYKRK